MTAEAQPEATWPEKGTPEYALWSAAVEVALAAPARQNPSTYDARVPWDTINQLREAIKGIGIDWNAFKADHDAQRKGEDR
jgi:hypothetical protein